MYKGREYEIYFPINSGDTSIEGVELATYQKLHFLGVPALNWFGVQANWTYINMEGEDRKILAQMPKHVINFALTYDNPDIGFSGTVGLNWNGMVFEKYEKGVPIWNTPIHRLDASANYALTDNIRVYVRGKNLLDSPGDPEWEYKPTLDETRLHEIKYYGRWFSAGIDYSL
ncbi:MAG: TonB-dependent receptor [candidate division KSB1 bacterium]|nr:TonB-dependent receptor [candidate division KSB1 bacterium]